jgi:DNA invertase Pin-like site-specific DNA recombinase
VSARTSTAARKRRAIGIVRVSEVKGRDGDAFSSPSDQLDAIRAACGRDGLELLRAVEELDVSGGTPLEERVGMRDAVEAVEAGEAQVIVAAYFDRLFRSLEVQSVILRRVEAAGGQVLALDTGDVTNGSAGEWLNATMRGMMAEYQRRTTSERSAAAQRRAIARGVAPWPKVPPGYDRGEDGRLVPNDDAPAVLEAFGMRAAGATIAEVRAHLQANGIERSYHGVQHLLTSRVYLGEIHFGGYEPNLRAHKPIVDADTFKRVQEVAVPRGKRAESDRLLARLGVLRCATCGGRMVVGKQTSNGRPYPFYRCPSVRDDCDRRVTISAEAIEALVVERVKEAIGDEEGRASLETNAAAAEDAVERAQANLDALIEMLDPLEPAARRRLREATEQRDQARERAQRLGGQTGRKVIRGARDWDRLSLEGRRALIRATVERVDVHPGRGLDRIDVDLFGE